MRNWNVKASKLPDCPNNHWYVTDCEVKGVVGMSAESLEELKELLTPAIQEINELGDQPETPNFC